MPLKAGKGASRKLEKMSVPEALLKKIDLTFAGDWIDDEETKNVINYAYNV